MRPVSFEDRWKRAFVKRDVIRKKSNGLSRTLCEGCSFLIKVFEDTVLGERNRYKLFALMRKDRPLDRGDAQGGGIVDVSLIV